jgi:hypothetical protein
MAESTMSGNKAVYTDTILSKAPAEGIESPQSGSSTGGSGAPSNGGSIRTVCVCSPSDAVRYFADWEDLTASAVERNVFYEPWMLIPAWEEFGQAHWNIRIVLVYLDSETGGRQKLIGLYPVYSRTSFHRIPVSVVAMWRHIHSPLSTPFLRSGFEQQALKGFFQWFDSPESGASVALFENIAGDGPFRQSLDEHLQSASRRSVEEGRYERALFCPAENAESYLQKALSGKRRKELRRQYNRLSELGKLDLIEMASDSDIDTWLSEFHALENQSWKGRNGSAITNRENERRYFDHTSREAFKRGQLMMLSLRLDGKPIAMKYNLISGEGSFSAKIAFDEQYAQYSPGVQLELLNVQVLHRRPGIRWMDSCAIPNHFMIERLWTERRVMTTLAVGGRGSRTGIILMAMPVILRLYRMLRRKG